MSMEAPGFHVPVGYGLRRSLLDHAVDAEQPHTAALRDRVRYMFQREVCDIDVEVALMI